MKRLAIWSLAALVTAGWMSATAAQASPPATAGVVVIHGTSYGHHGKYGRYDRRQVYRKHRNGDVRYYRDYRKRMKYRQGNAHRSRHGYGYRHRYWVPGHHDRWGVWIPGQWVLLWRPYW